MIPGMIVRVQPYFYDTYDTNNTWYDIICMIYRMISYRCCCCVRVYIVHFTPDIQDVGYPGRPRSAVWYLRSPYYWIFFLTLHHGAWYTKSAWYSTWYLVYYTRYIRVGHERVSSFLANHQVLTLTPRYYNTSRCNSSTQHVYYLL